MSDPSRTVLVTGAGGFIGSHLAAEQLRLGRRVVALDLHLDRLAHMRDTSGLTLIEGDSANPDDQRRALRGVDTVFHLAAAHLGASVPDSEFRRVNVEGVRTLIAAAREAGVRRFVHCSSVGVYGEVTNPPYNEDSPCRPELAYERTKLEGEQVVLDAARREGFPAVVLRPVWVYGPGCPRTEKLFRSIGKGRFFLVGRADTLRHCVYIRDMVDAFDRAAQRNEAIGQVMVIGDDGAIPVRTLVNEIARLSGAKPPVTMPKPIFLTAAIFFEAAFGILGKEPPISRRTMRFFTGNTSFDISRARRLLGYDPSWSLAAGLGETAEILRRGPFRIPLPAPAAS